MIGEQIKQPEIKMMIEAAEKGNNDIRDLLRNKLGGAYLKAKRLALAETIGSSGALQQFIQKRAAQETAEKEALGEGLQQ